MKSKLYKTVFLLFALFSFATVSGQNSSSQKILNQLAPLPGYHTLVGPADNLYNCYGLAFSLCETGLPQVIPDGYTLYQTYIASGLFKEVAPGSAGASKVLYWNNDADFANRNPDGLDHAAMITNNNTVRSKEGLNGLYENDLNYYYLTDSYTSWYRVYALNIDLSTTNGTPKYGDVFTVSTVGKLDGASYSWNYDSSLLQAQTPRDINANSMTFKVISTQYTTTSISLTVKHQMKPTGGVVNGVNYSAIYSKTLTSRISITIGTKPPQQPIPVSGYVTGDATINVGSTGSYRVVITQGTAPYTIEWFLRKGNDGQGSVLVATGSTLTLKSVQTASLMKKTSAITRQPIYYTDFYLSARITDANRTQCTTSELHIGAYGYVNLIPFGPEKALGNSSLEQDGVASFTVYPNPATDQITVQSSMLLDEPAKVTVYNALIIPVVTFQFDENAHTIDLGNIPAGLYIVKIEYKNYVETKRIVVN